MIAEEELHGDQEQFEELNLHSCQRLDRGPYVLRPEKSLLIGSLFMGFLDNRYRIHSANDLKLRTKLNHSETLPPVALLLNSLPEDVRNPPMFFCPLPYALRALYVTFTHGMHSPTSEHSEQLLLYFLSVYDAMAVANSCLNPIGDSRSRELTLHHVSSEATSGGHPQLNIRVLVHHHQGGLSVYRRPLHHHVVLPTDQVEVQPSVVPCVIGVGRQRPDADTVTVALGAVEAGAIDDRVDVSRFHDLGKVLDSPHGIGATRLRQADVVDVDATGRQRGVTAHGLESIAKFRPFLQWDVGDLPCVVGIRCATGTWTRNLTICEQYSYVK